MKIGIVGLSSVGSTIAYLIAVSGIAEKLVLVDLLSLYLTKHSGLGSRQVIGSGTLLDTSRFRHLISKRINVDPRNVHTYIIGEHGEGSIPVWSHTQIGALHLDDFAEQSNIAFGPGEKKQVFEAVLSAGKEVIKRKGATFYGITQTVLRILTAILRDEKSILTVSTKVQGYADADDLTLSLPNCRTQRRGKIPCTSS